MIRFKSFENLVERNRLSAHYREQALMYIKAHRMNCHHLAVVLMNDVIDPCDTHHLVRLSFLFQKHLASIHRNKNFHIQTSDFKWFLPKMVAYGVLVEKRQYVRPNGVQYSVVRMTPDYRRHLIELIEQSNVLLGCSKS